MQNKGKRKNSALILSASFMIPAVVNAAQNNVTNANISSNVADFVKYYSRSLYKCISNYPVHVISAILCFIAVNFLLLLLTKPSGEDNIQPEEKDYIQHKEEDYDDTLLSKSAVYNKKKSKKSTFVEKNNNIDNINNINNINNEKKEEKDNEHLEDDISTVASDVDEEIVLDENSGEYEIVKFVEHIKNVKGTFSQEDRDGFKQTLVNFKDVLAEEADVHVIHLAEDEEILEMGDIHANVASLEDVVKRFVQRRGEGKKVKLLFKGDYGDRGAQGPYSNDHLNSAKTWYILAKLKTMFPKEVFLLRGNHEEGVVTAKGYGGVASYAKAMHNNVAVGVHEGNAYLTDAEIDKGYDVDFVEDVVKNFFEPLPIMIVVIDKNGEKTLNVHGSIPANFKEGAEKSMMEALMDPKNKGKSHDYQFNQSYLKSTKSCSAEDYLFYPDEAMIRLSIRNQCMWNDVGAENEKTSLNPARGTTGYSSVGRKDIIRFCAECGITKINSGHYHLVDKGYAVKKIKEEKEGGKEYSCTISMTSPNMNYQRLDCANGEHNGGHIVVTKGDGTVDTLPIRYDVSWKKRQYKTDYFNPMKMEGNKYFKWVKTTYKNKTGNPLPVIVENSLDKKDKEDVSDRLTAEEEQFVLSCFADGKKKKNKKSKKGGGVRYKPLCGFFRSVKEDREGFNEDEKNKGTLLYQYTDESGPPKTKSFSENLFVKLRAKKDDGKGVCIKDPKLFIDSNSVNYITKQGGYTLKMQLLVDNVKDKEIHVTTKPLNEDLTPEDICKLFNILFRLEGEDELQYCVVGGEEKDENGNEKKEYKFFIGKKRSNEKRDEEFIKNCFFAKKIIPDDIDGRESAPIKDFFKQIEDKDNKLRSLLQDNGKKKKFSESLAMCVFGGDNKNIDLVDISSNFYCKGDEDKSLYHLSMRGPENKEDESWMLRNDLTAEQVSALFTLLYLDGTDKYIMPRKEDNNYVFEVKESNGVQAVKENVLKAFVSGKSAQEIVGGELEQQGKQFEDDKVVKKNSDEPVKNAGGGTTTVTIKVHLVDEQPGDGGKEVKKENEHPEVENININEEMKEMGDGSKTNPIDDEKLEENEIKEEKPQVENEIEIKEENKEENKEEIIKEEIIKEEKPQVENLNIINE